MARRLLAASIVALQLWINHATLWVHIECEPICYTQPAGGWCAPHHRPCGVMHLAFTSVWLPREWGLLLTVVSPLAVVLVWRLGGPRLGVASLLTTLYYRGTLTLPLIWSLFSLASL